MERTISRKYVWWLGNLFIILMGKDEAANRQAYRYRKHLKYKIDI